MRLKIAALVAVGGIFSAAAAGAQVMRTGYERPKYETQHKDGEMELRAYGPRIVAETTVPRTNFRSATSTGFGRLAGFIFGKNRTHEGASAKIAMTSPVESVPAADGAYTVVFTMPSGYDLADLPTPQDPNVRIRQVEPATVATLRFSGVARNKDIDALSDRLLAWVERQGYVATSPVSIAQYDPPWVIGPFRRNELMVNVGPAPAAD